MAVLGRSQRAMEAPSGACSTDCPSPSASCTPTTAGEFLNNHLVRFWGEASTGLTLSRSRPYQKNDNRFVEQKNDSLVRAYLGHGRFDTPARPTRSTPSTTRCGPTTTCSSQCSIW